MDGNNTVADQIDPLVVVSTRPESAAPTRAAGKVCDLLVVGHGAVVIEAVRAAIQQPARVVLIQQPDPPEGVAIEPADFLQALTQVDRQLGPGLRSARSEASPGGAAPAAADRRGAEIAAALQRSRHPAARSALSAAAEQWTRQGGELLRGPATFTGPQTLVVGDRELRFRRAIIAPGHRPEPPEYALSDDSRPLTEETLDRWKQVPERLAVFGGSVKACQWAQIFRRLGSEVHLIDRGHALAAEEDPQVASILENQLRQDQVRMHLGCQDLSIQPLRRRKVIVIARADGKEKLMVDELFCCGPKRLNVAGWGLDAAGVGRSERAIAIDSALRTTNPRIFAVGAACGPRFASPAAVEMMARAAVGNALGRVEQLWPRRLDWHLLPRCLYQRPQIVQLGLTHHEIAARGNELDTYRQVVAAAEHSAGEEAWSEFIEVVVDRFSGRVASVTAVANTVEPWIAPLLA